MSRVTHVYINTAAAWIFAIGGTFIICFLNFFQSGNKAHVNPSATYTRL